MLGTVYVQAHSFHWKAGPRVWCPLGELEYCQEVAARCDSGLYVCSSGNAVPERPLPRLCWWIQGTGDLRDEGACFLRHCVRAIRNFRGARRDRSTRRSSAAFAFSLSSGSYLIAGRRRKTVRRALSPSFAVPRWIGSGSSPPSSRT